MEIAVICFTKKGFETEKRLVQGLGSMGHRVRPFCMGKYALQSASQDHSVSFGAVREGGLGSWAGEQFGETDAVIFVGACGIAVRAIAPFVRDKRTDPAVLSVDEAGRFVIPLLSGHIGGANQLALAAADLLAACPVITTATDGNRLFAVDVFASERGFLIDSMETAKKISADLLAGNPVGLFCDFPPGPGVPSELSVDRICPHNIWITVSKSRKPGIGGGRLLKLIPRCVAVGIGCRRGTEREKIREVLLEALEENQVDVRSLFGAASIDLKSGEAGLCELTRELGIPFLTYTREELEAVPGQFTDSEFVRRTTGVGNVCERAALAACMEGAGKCRVLFRKHARDGVTVAAAYFEPELFTAAEDG